MTSMSSRSKTSRSSGSSRTGHAEENSIGYFEGQVIAMPINYMVGNIEENSATESSKRWDTKPLQTLVEVTEMDDDPMTSARKKE